MSNIRPPQPQPVRAAQGNPQASPGGGRSVQNVWQNLGIPGLVLILAGLALCGSFFLPWFSSSLLCSDPVCQPPTMKDTHFLSHYASSPKGFSIANGTFALTTSGPLASIHEGFGFLLLWVVFLAGLLLIALPLLLALGKIDAGRTRVFLLALCVLTLGLEIAYGINAAQALPNTKKGLAAVLNALALPAGHQAVYDFSTGPAGGFWLALVATVVAGGTSVLTFTPVAGRRYNVGLFWRNLGLAGQATLVAGVALLLAFFLPWFTMPAPAAGLKETTSKTVVKVAQMQTASGWTTAAQGLQTPLLASGSCASCGISQISIFLSLWLVPIAALALVAIAWLLSRGSLWRRMASILTCITLLVALFVEVIFLLEVQSLQSYEELIVQSGGQQLTGTAYSVTWGFWAAFAVAGVALLLSGLLLLQRHKSVTGMPARP